MICSTISPLHSPGILQLIIWCRAHDIIYPELCKRTWAIGTSLKANLYKQIRFIFTLQSYLLYNITYIFSHSNLLSYGLLKNKTRTRNCRVPLGNCRVLTRNCRVLTRNCKGLTRNGRVLTSN